MLFMIVWEIMGTQTHKYVIVNKHRTKQFAVKERKIHKVLRKFMAFRRELDSMVQA